jgi:hypothetical protein
MPPPERTVREAAALMLRFAERTGLDGVGPPQRYLWTDAFAVCNALALADATGEERWNELALRLVDQVHDVLGRFRADDPRSGWISGLGEAEGARHPTRGGLRIGKDLPERGPGEPPDERLEWDRDGQYFHYLTKWMHALDQVARRTGEARFNVWALELAETAHAAFTVDVGGRGGGRRMVWKMSTDLSRPLVSSMGQHDPLDGYVTCLQVQATARALGSASSGPTLEEEIADFAAMAESQGWATADPLGLGGLLMDACRVAQLTARGAIEGESLRNRLLAAALEGLAFYLQTGELRQPPSRRLAFRELGLAIGLSGLEIVERQAHGPAETSATRAKLAALLEAYRPYHALGAAIASTWLAAQRRDDDAWADHRDINEVMLATSLVPAGCLVLSAPG